MLIDIKEEHKQRYGYIFRLCRIQAKMTQKMVVNQLQLLSLRSYIQMECGKPLKDPEVYDALCAFFHVHYNYESDPDEVIREVAQNLLDYYIRYDTKHMVMICDTLLSILTPMCKYIYESLLYKCIDILMNILEDERNMTKEEYEYCENCYPILPDTLQSVFASYLYKYEYDLPHRDQKLHDLFLNLTPLYKPDHIRNAITYCLHMINKTQDYLSPYQVLLPYEDTMRETENWAGLFDVYHWLMLIFNQIAPSNTKQYRDKAIELIHTHDIPQQRILVFYANLSGIYFKQENYKKATETIEYYLRHDNHNPLPSAIWYLYYIRLQRLPYPQWVTELDVSNCSTQLRVLWEYFLMRIKNAPANTAQDYIMTDCLPYLIHLAPEFQQVFLLELKDLITKTRKYKDLYLYLEQLRQ